MLPKTVDPRKILKQSLFFEVEIQPRENGKEPGAAGLGFVYPIQDFRAAGPWGQEDALLKIWAY